jgi:hypothetical protein
VEKVLIEELNELLHGDPYTVHPAAELFPLVEGEDFESLVNSIREHGVQTPVMFGWDENEKPVLLDGRNRLRAVERLKEQGITVQVPVRSFDYTRDGITEVEWIESQNIDRRHLTDDARAMLAASLHELIEAEAAQAKKDSQFNADTARAAAAKRHDKTATTDSPSPQKRDRKKSEARTTAAKVGAKAKVSKHKAKQAIATVKAIKAGTVSPDVRTDVIAGKTGLKGAVPAKAKPDKSKRHYESIDDEIRVAVNSSWSHLRGKFAPGFEHKKLRAAMIALVREEQKQFDK